MSTAIQLVPSSSPVHNAESVAAAFLAGFPKATRTAYARDLRAWGGFLAGLDVKVFDAHRVHVDAWCREAEETGIAPATLARRLSAISGFYAYAEDEGLVERSPVARVRRPRVSDDSPRLGVDRNGLQALLTAAEASSPRDHALIALLALNGLRISEALALDVEHVSEQRGHRTIELVRKHGKHQTVALAPHTIQALEQLLDDRTSGAIFQTSTGARLDRQAAYKTVRRLAQTAGIPHNVSPHSLRHSFVTAALDAGVPLRDVQDAAGHADPRTTRRYDRARGALDRSATYAVAAYIGKA